MGIVAKVKAVQSGDTLVLKSTKSGAEKTLSLAFVSAPKLRREGDEPHAFASRDYLRKLVVGKEVQFQVLYTVQQINREYGIVTLADGRNLIEVAVQEGIVKLRDDAGKREEQPETETLLEKLKIYEDQARTAGKGVWSSEDDGRIDSKYESPSNPQEFLENHKGKQIDAIVERVISGDRFAVRLLLEPKTHQQLVLLLAGVRTPVSQRQDAQGVIHPAEEHGDEAKEFVELRLLQRSVKVVLLGVSPQGQLVGNIIHPAGSIAGLMLSQGLGRCVDFHSNMLGPDMANLRAAEKSAKDNKLRLWKAHVVKTRDSANSFDAVVSRIMNADTIMVRNKAGAERKINLSSVRQPKPSDPAQSPFQADAKEFLRKKLIGKHIRFHIDGKRPAQDGFEEREMATVTFNNKNIALLLVENGYASVIRHRREDEDRSPIWDELSAAEETARSQQKGMWSPKPPKQTGKMVEASETLQKAKSHLAFLQRQKKVPAVVDFVSSGSRFKVIIPRENTRLTFVLSGIRAPRTARNPTEVSEPFGQEALDFAVRKCMQRDVEIDVEDIDRVGGFIGTMYLNRESVSKMLVEEGLASVHAYSAEKSGHGNELFAAENRAKTAKKGMWHDYDPSAESTSHEESHNTSFDTAPKTYEKKKDYRDVVVVDISPECTLKLQLVGPGTAKLEELMTQFRNFHISPANNKPLSNPPKVGDLVSARFSADKEFYRARVRRVDRQNQTVDVTYIDHGNSETIPFTSLRSLPPQFSTSKLPGQARDAVLSFLQFPPGEQDREDARDLLADLTGGDRRLVANVEHEDQGVLYVTLYDPEDSHSTEESLNAEIVAQGWAKVLERLRPWEKVWEDGKDSVVARLRERQQTAMIGPDRKGCWVQGDPFPYEE